MQCDTWLWDDMPLKIRPTVRHIGILLLVSISTISPQSIVILHQSAKVIQIVRPQQKMTSWRFSRWRISAILNFRGPIFGSLKSPSMTSYIGRQALNCLVFFLRKSRFSFWRQTDGLTNRQTDRQVHRIKPLSLKKWNDPINARLRLPDRPKTSLDHNTLTHSLLRLTSWGS